MPDAADSQRAENGFSEWADLARTKAKSAEDAGEKELAAAMEQAARDDRAHELLAAIFGNSPWLTRCTLSQPDTFCQTIADGPEPVLEQALATAKTGKSRDEVMTALRRARMTMALAVGIADISGAWDVARVTEALSTFADVAVSSALACLLNEAVERGEIEIDDPEDPAATAGLFILGVGKLGAFELNYSSDIDLIALYDPARLRYVGRQSPQQFYVRCVRDLVSMLESRTRDGFVFRTDLRLRPDPGSTPLAVSVEAAELYYESTGQNWERAALIKSRVIAGDREAGKAFLHMLEPFLWRKNLDFAAIQDIHSIKRQIHAQRGGATITVAGHNLKLGRGGIREIEFFAQTQQLIWGGRVPTLRTRGTCAALAALAAEGRITETARDELVDSYEFLRRAEHRLQMVDDRQTHSLPTEADALEKFAVFLDFDSADSLAAEVVGRMEAVEHHYAQLFEEAPSLSGAGNLVFTGSEDDPDTLETLDRMGFSEGPWLSEQIRGWHRGRYRATRSARARELLTELVPTLLESLAKTANPDAAFRNFDSFLSRLPAGVQLFSLFIANPGLLDLVAEIMGSAPRLAAHLATYPSLLDGVLAGDFYGEIENRAELRARLESMLDIARDFEDVLDRARRFANDHRFQVGMHILRGKLDADSAGEALTDLAEVMVEALFRRVQSDFAAKHGHVPGPGMALVALGKLGSREITEGSDLDLLFVYDNTDDSSDGDKPLAASQYYARLSQQVITAISAPTAEGRLYEVDMRLRPSGNAGPIATSLAAFTSYQRQSAWTWEHMALTRARVIAGDDQLAQSITGTVREVLNSPRDTTQLRKDVLDMRTRLARGHPATSDWDVKYMAGGLIDVEFIAQYLQLHHGPENPDVLHPRTGAALKALGEAGALPQEDAEFLIGAGHFWRTVQGILRFAVEGGFDPRSAPAGLKAILVQATESADFEALEEKRQKMSGGVRAIFIRLIGDPAD